jgi:hypothetical protein
MVMVTAEAPIIVAEEISAGGGLNVGGRRIGSETLAMTTSIKAVDAMSGAGSRIMAVCRAGIVADGRSAMGGTDKQHQ